MGPKKAAELFKARQTSAVDRIEVELYGSLASTGKGHLTDKAISDVFSGYPVNFIWKPKEFLPRHPNAMCFKAYRGGRMADSWTVYSIGGGEIEAEGSSEQPGSDSVYDTACLSQILSECMDPSRSFFDYILEKEPSSLETMEVLGAVMKKAVRRGLTSETLYLPGPLQLKRRAKDMFNGAQKHIGSIRDLNLVSAYALAVAEENADGGQIVTAPTCGSCGVLPGILYFLYENCHMAEREIFKAMAIAGLFGVSVATRGSISGAEVGCQGEIGTACAMASAAAAYLLGGNNSHIEYAAEMGLEHFLGLTCDPIKGYVQIPCIERNAFAAMRALECASYALSTDGSHIVSFDSVVSVMKETGGNLLLQYRETSLGGLAAVYHDKYENG
jgi:L-serine dehydratase